MNKKEAILDILKTPSKEEKFKTTKWIAYVIGEIAHCGQYRDNGKNYFVHPKHCVNAFYDLLSIEGWIDYSVIIKHDIPYGVIELAYLHDVVEDTHFTIEVIKEEFGETVAFLVGMESDNIERL